MIQEKLKSTLATLVSYPSITPDDANCQAWLIEQLKQLGFNITTLPSNKVSNFYAELGSNDGPSVAFAGHTDVVTTGDPAQWQTPPFELSEHTGHYVGRGVADMKGGIAAFLLACETFLAEKPNFKGKIAWIITSAEEGDDYLDGTPVIMDHLQTQQIKIDHCIVGEPSSQITVGDIVRVGRRGSLSAYLTIHGVQGHVAYPDLAENPIHTASAFLQALTTYEWDQGNDFFPKTTLQVSYIASGDPTAGNVIPGELKIHFNLRYSSELTHEQIQTQVEALLQAHQLKYELHWKHSGAPFLTESGLLIDNIQSAIQKVQNIKPELSTGGGTSDGRFIAPYGIEVVELGLCNDTIHQVNEKISIESLEVLYNIYLETLRQFY